MLSLKNRIIDKMSKKGVVMKKVDTKYSKNTWAIGGGLLLGLGVGFFFLYASALFFVGSLIAGLGNGLILAAILHN